MLLALMIPMFCTVETAISRQEPVFHTTASWRAESHELDDFKRDESLLTHFLAVDLPQTGDKVKALVQIVDPAESG